MISLKSRAHRSGVVEEDPVLETDAIPRDIASGDWVGIARAVWKETGDDNISIVAAGIAFYAFAALVPLLTALVLSYGLFADASLAVSNARSLLATLPADVASIITDQLEDMASGDAKTGLALLAALLIALYGASKGASSVMTGLNIAWGVSETRSFARRTFVGLALTAGTVLTLVTGIFAIGVIAFIESLLPTLGGTTHALFRLLVLGVGGLAVTLLLAAVYWFAPNRPGVAWRWITPGSIFATIVWLSATVGFAVYVGNFGNYNATYGSLGAVIVFLTWLYITSYVILIGGELNAVFEQRVKK